jgi:hypothetical protein
MSLNQSEHSAGSNGPINELIPATRDVIMFTRTSQRSYVELHWFNPHSFLPLLNKNNSLRIQCETCADSPRRVACMRQSHISHSKVIHGPEYTKTAAYGMATFYANQARYATSTMLALDLCNKIKLDK